MPICCKKKMRVSAKPHPPPRRFRLDLYIRVPLLLVCLSVGRSVGPLLANFNFQKVF